MELIKAFLYFQNAKRFYNERINVALFTRNRKAQPYMRRFVWSLHKLSRFSCWPRSANFTQI